MNTQRFDFVMSKRLRQQIADVAIELEMTQGQFVRFALAEWMARRVALGKGGFAELARGPRIGRPPRQKQARRKDHPAVIVVEAAE
jgi:hypothetical protein